MIFFFPFLTCSLHRSSTFSSAIDDKSSSFSVSDLSWLAAPEFAAFCEPVSDPWPMTFSYTCSMTFRTWKHVAGWQPVPAGQRKFELETSIWEDSWERKRGFGKMLWLTFWEFWYLGCCVVEGRMEFCWTWACFSETRTYQNSYQPLTAKIWTTEESISITTKKTKVGSMKHWGGGTPLEPLAPGTWPDTAASVPGFLPREFLAILYNAPLEH